MWRLLVIIAFAGAPAYADITHKLQSSVQLTVDAAAANATRLDPLSPSAVMESIRQTARLLIQFLPVQSPQVFMRLAQSLRHRTILGVLFLSVSLLHRR